MGSYLNLDTLSAPGVTAALPVSAYQEHVIQCKVTNVNTNVVLRIEGSNDGTNFFNLSETEEDTTITADGTYGFKYSGLVEYIRVRMVSEDGGTDVTVTSTYSGR